MIKMVKCPYCGEEVSINEYIAHVSQHEEPFFPGITEARREGKPLPRGVGALKEVGSSLDNLLQDMGRGWKARDFDYFLRAGMEALVEVGARIGLKNIHEYTVRVKSGVYNNLAIAILSAHKGDWEEARIFLNKAIYELGMIDMETNRLS